MDSEPAVHGQIRPRSRYGTPKLVEVIRGKGDGAGHDDRRVGDGRPRGLAQRVGVPPGRPCSSAGAAIRAPRATSTRSGRAGPTAGPGLCGALAGPIQHRLGIGGFVPRFPPAAGVEGVHDAERLADLVFGHPLGVEF